MFVVLGTSLSTQFYWIHWGYAPDKHYKTTERVLKENIIWNSLLNFRSLILNKDSYFSILFNCSEQCRWLPQKGVRHPGPGITGSCELPSVCQELNMGPPQEQLVLLAVEPSPLPHKNPFDSFLWLFSNRSDIVFISPPLLMGLFLPLAFLTVMTAMFPSAFHCPIYYTASFCPPWS